MVAETGGPVEMSEKKPSWSTWQEAIVVITYRPHLTQTVLTALIVGTVLFCINQLNVVLQDGLTTAVAIKSGVTYLVPFSVSNMGMLLGTRRTSGEVDTTGDPPHSEKVRHRA